MSMCRPPQHAFVRVKHTVNAISKQEWRGSGSGMNDDVTGGRPLGVGQLRLVPGGCSLQRSVGREQVNHWESEPREGIIYTKT